MGSLVYFLSLFSKIVSSNYILETDIEILSSTSVYNMDDYRMSDKSNLKVELFAEAEIPTEFGKFLVSVYNNNKNDDETVL